MSGGGTNHPGDWAHAAGFFLSFFDYANKDIHSDTDAYSGQIIYAYSAKTPIGLLTSRTWPSNTILTVTELREFHTNFRIISHPTTTLDWPVGSREGGRHKIYIEKAFVLKLNA